MPNIPLNSNVQVNQNTLPVLVDNVTSQFIVTPLAPSTIGISGFIFDIIGAEAFMLDSEITDSFTETNISYQDQIALRPEQFTLSGYVGELANNLSNNFVNILMDLVDYGVPPGFNPTLNAQDEQFYEEQALIAASENNIINTVESVYGLFSNFSTTATKQQNAFQYFYNLWLSRTLCEVETPWGILENMAILNVRAKQDEITRMVTDFSITFKAMRFANTLSPATQLSQQAIPIPSIAGSDQANAVLQNVPDQGGTVAGSLTNNTILSNYAIGQSSITIPSVGGG